MKKGFILPIGIFLGFILSGFVFIYFSNAHKIPISVVHIEIILTPEATLVGNSQEIIPSGNILDINTASVEEFILLPGIGNTKANAIIEYREKNGKFKSIDDLLLVPGIGPDILSHIREFISVNDMIP